MAKASVIDRSRRSRMDPLTELCARLEEAAAQNTPGVERLAKAGTSVCLRLTGRESALTLLLDRTPVEIVPGAYEADVEVWLSAEVAERFVVGEARLPSEILRGRVSYRGPVRSFLSVTPILRSLLTAHGCDDRERGLDQPGRRDLTSADSNGDPPADGQAEPFREQEQGDFWAIECRGVHKRLGSQDVLRGVNLGIPEGTINVILGPSGTGKSVLLKHIIGLLFPDEGEILVRGQSLSTMHLSELLALRRRLGILFQDGALFGSMDLYDNVAFPLRQHTDLTEREIFDVVSQGLTEVGLAGSEHKMPGELSGGMRKRAGLARALVLEPEIVLFDEPDSGLDPVRTALLCDLIQKTHATHGGTYIVITHDIASARRIGEYLAVLWRGRIVEAGDRDEMFGSADPFVCQFLAGDVAGPLGME